MGDDSIKIDLALDTSKYDRSLTGAIRSSDKLSKSLDAIETDGVKIDLKLDTSAVNKAEGDVKALNSINAKPTVSVQVDQTKLTDLLNEMKSGYEIGVKLYKATAGPIVDDIAGDRAAVGAFALATGQTREDAAAVGSVIDTVWNTGLAESKTQIAGIAATLFQAGVDLDEIGSAATDALTIAAATGEDVSSIISAQVTLVKSGLAPSYREASDLLAGGFAGGLNKADDLLDTIKEYSRDFADLGLTGKGFFDILTAGLEGGAYNTDKIADSFRELKIRVGTALGTGEGAEFDALKNLGLLDEARAFQAGTLTGQAFTEAVLAATETGGLGDLVGVFGSPLEDLGVGVFETINDALANPTLLSTWQGTTDTMRDTLSNSLDVSFKRAYNSVVNDLASGFEIAGQPLINLIDSLPEKLNEFSDLLESGAGIPEALSVVLEAPELAVTLRNLQGAIGGFIIDFQLGLAAVLSAFGQGDAAQSLSTSASGAAGQQLIFDLQFSDDTADIDQAFKDATRRGVSDGFREQAVIEATTAIANEMGVEAASSFVDDLNALTSGATIVVRVAGEDWLGNAGAGEAVEIPIQLVTGETPEETWARLFPTPDNGNDPLVQRDPAFIDTLTAGGLNPVTAALGNLTTTFIKTNLDTSLTDAANAALEAATPIDPAAVQANIEPALRGAWDEAIRNVLTDPSAVNAKASADALLTMFNSSLLNSGVEPVTMDELIDMSNLGLLQSKVDETTGLFVSMSHKLGGQVTLTNDTVVTSYRLMSDGIKTNVHAGANAVDDFGVRVTTTLSAINDAAMITQQHLFDAGVDPTAFAALVFGTSVNARGTSSEGYFPGRAGGGDVQANRPYWVGENGPELYFPGQNGYIVPHDKSMGMGGNTTVYNTTYNVNQTLTAASMSQASSVGTRFANTIRGF